MMRPRRRTAALYVAAIALLTGCGHTATVGGGPFGEPAQRGDGEASSDFMTVEVSVRNQTDRDAQVTALEGPRTPERRVLGEVGRGQQSVFQARLGFGSDVRFEIGLRGGGGCFCSSDAGMSQSVYLTIQPGVSRTPGVRAPACMCQLTVL